MTKCITSGGLRPRPQGEIDGAAMQAAAGAAVPAVADELPDEPCLTLTAYRSEPGTPGADNLALLVSWAATHAQTPTAASTGQS